MSFLDLTKKVIRQWQGPITEETELKQSPLGLSKLPKNLHPEKKTAAVCGFCSTGCSVEIHLKDGDAINVSPNYEYPVNLGMACPKGWEVLAPLEADDRAKTPRLKRNGGLEACDWDTALKEFTSKAKGILSEHGPGSFAFLSTGQIPMEEMAFLGSLSKFGMGMIHGDGNTRQCMASAAVGYKQAFGFDAPPFTYADFEESDTLVFIGANPCIAHPIMWRRVLRNQNDPNIIVLDPRKTETAMTATHHYPLAPKSDMTLFYALAKILIQNNWIDKNYIEQSTEGFDGFANHVSEYTLDKAVSETGLSEEQILELAELIRKGKKVSFWWTMGVNQSHQGVRTIHSIINLALMTNNIGRPGTGANSITGQVNAMGSRIFSNTTSLLGGRDFLNPDHRQEVADILGISESSIPQQNSLPYNKIIDGVEKGEIKGLWIIATNPGHSWIDRSRLERLAQKLDFLVVQDMYETTETAKFADLILPAAGWGEKEGVVINSERRLGLFKKVKQAPGQALSDFNIFRLIAKYWGCEEMFRDWTSPEAAFQILKKLSKGRPCDFSGIEDYCEIDRESGVQWPFPEGAIHQRERRLFEDGKYFTPSGKAQMLYEESVPPLEVPDQEYPIVLLTGRGTSAQWHTNTRTGKSEVLKKLYPKDIYVEIHPAYAKKLGVESGDKVYVHSRRGSIVAAARVMATVQEDHVFIPMHYDTTNLITFASFDPYSFQPSYKASAVRLEKLV